MSRNNGTASPVHRWREVVRHSRLRPLHKLVLIELSDFMDWSTLGSAHPGPALLANRIGCGSRTVERALKAGLEAGLIRQTYKGGSRGGVRRTSVYRGVFPGHTSDSGDTSVSRDYAITVTSTSDSVADQRSDNPGRGAYGAARSRSLPAPNENDASKEIRALVDTTTDNLINFEEKLEMDEDVPGLVDAFEDACGDRYWTDLGKARDHIDPQAQTELRALCAEVDTWVQNEGAISIPYFMANKLNRLRRAGKVRHADGTT